MKSVTCLWCYVAVSVWCYVVMSVVLCCRVCVAVCCRVCVAVCCRVCVAVCCRVCVAVPWHYTCVGVCVQARCRETYPPAGSCPQFHTRQLPVSTWWMTRNHLVGPVGKHISPLCVASRPCSEVTNTKATQYFLCLFIFGVVPILM